MVASIESRVAGTLRWSLTIHVTAGGWRSDSARVTVGAARATTVLSETWRGRIEDAWRPYGQPRPLLVPGPGGVASFLNNGDGRFSSSGYSARTFSASSGLGMDVDISTPVASTHWQVLHIRLDADLDSVALARWDHSTAYLPGTDLAAGESTVCLAAVPAAAAWPLTAGPFG